MANRDRFHQIKGNQLSCATGPHHPHRIPLFPLTSSGYGCIETRAVIVKDGKILSEGMNRAVASHDPTWHGEMEAIRLACITLQSFKLTQLCQEDAVKVWKEYQAKPDKIHY